MSDGFVAIRIGFRIRISPSTQSSGARKPRVPPRTTVVVTVASAKSWRQSSKSSRLADGSGSCAPSLEASACGSAGGSGFDTASVPLRTKPCWTACSYAKVCYDLKLLRRSVAPGGLSLSSSAFAFHGSSRQSRAVNRIACRYHCRFVKNPCCSIQR